MDKEIVINIYIYIYICDIYMHISQSLKKKEILQFAITWMNFECVMLSEIKSEKDKYCMISLIRGI